MSDNKASNAKKQQTKDRKKMTRGRLEARRKIAKKLLEIKKKTV